MSPGTPKSPAIALQDARDLILDAIGLAEKGLELNPSTEQRRRLDQVRVDLEMRLTAVQAKLDAVGMSTVTGPTPEQVAEISRLTKQVGNQTNASITASAAVRLSTRVLKLATDVSRGAAPGPPTG